MNDYLIGSGALLTAGPRSGIAGATLHAQTDPALAASVGVALVDFESSSLDDLSRVMLLARGWNPQRARAELIDPLVRQGACSLAEVLARLAHAAGVAEVHLFARWLPDELLAAALRKAGIGLVAHPLEAIRQAALISGQTYSRWPLPLRAA